MADLTYKRVVLSGLDPAPVAADVAGDNIPPSGRGFLQVHNGGAASIDVTITTPGKTQFGLDEPDVVVTVPAGADRLIGPLSPALYNPGTKGVEVNYSDVTSVPVSALFV